MPLTTTDYLIIVCYILVITGIGLLYSRKAGSSLVQFFASGRSLPWWLAGTSMVATTFAADTPLAVVSLTAKHGMAGNWFWWSFALGGMLTVFVYAQLWRRAEVLTDVELIQIRYSGTPARFLRYTRAIYVSMIVNPIIIGWVVKAMLSVLDQTVLYAGPPVIGAEPALSSQTAWLVVLIMMALVALYATMSGMWGVALADVVQFVVAMVGCIWLAVVAWNHVGGAEAMTQQVIANTGNEHAFNYLPTFDASNEWMPLHIFVILIGVQWWATWYPGAEPGGGGYVVQRMAASKDETNALLATWWYQVAHYCLRPWPWLIVAFAAIASYPELMKMDDPGVGFPMIMRDLCPPGLRGLMLVAFFSAFMSTISTQMNWGASYLVNDFILPCFAPKANEKTQTRISRWVSVFMILVGSIVAVVMDRYNVSVDDAWKLLVALGAGSGLVYMLRWYWWRINAWSEISAMLASLLYFLVLSSSPFTTLWESNFGQPPKSEELMSLVALLTIATWIPITFLTRPEPDQLLSKFYRKVHPFALGWRPFAAKHTDVKPDTDLGLRLLSAVLGATVIYSVLPGTGYALFGQYGMAAVAGLVAAAAAVGLFFTISRLELR